MSEVKIPEGYKQTEVGVIPKDWEVKDIGETLTIKHGKDQKQVESAHGQYPIFGTGGQMGWANDFLYDKPSVLIGRKGSINKPRYINVPFWTVDTLFYSQVHNGYNEKFMFYKFCLIDWTTYNEASGVPSLNARTISNVKISVPKKQEQTAIATALSDVDNLIQSLEKLIAKKEVIKTGTMQQLLTGKTRLPDFATREDGSPKGFKQTELGQIPEDWEVRKLNQISDVKSGGTPSTSDSSYWNGSILWCTPTDITALKSQKYLSNTLKKITKAGLENSSAELLPIGSIVMTSRATIGECAITTKNISTNQGFKNFICFDNTNNEFLYYNLSNSKNRLVQLCSGSTFLEISTTQTRNFEIAVPSIQEQTAIATILSDIDTEIQALQQRLEKTKDIKQGMMQQLLTGKVRLAH